MVLDRVPRWGRLAISGLGMLRAKHVGVPAGGVLAVPTRNLPKAHKAAGVHPVLTLKVVVVLRQVQRHTDPANRERQPDDRQDDRLVPSRSCAVGPFHGAGLHAGAPFQRGHGARLSRPRLAR